MTATVDLRERVEGWLEDFGLPHEPHPLDDEGKYQWALRVSGQSFAMIVAHRDVSYEHLFMQIQLLIADQHKEALRALPERDRTLFFYDLNLALHGQPVGHTMEFEKDQSGADTAVLKWVMLGINLMEEPITRAGFFRRNHLMQTAAQIAALMFQKMTYQGNWA